MNRTARIGAAVLLTGGGAGRRWQTRHHRPAALERYGPIDAVDGSAEGAGRTALVTGASSGIGWAIAQLLAAKGYQVVLVARDAARLEQRAAELRASWSVPVHVQPADLGAADGAESLLARLATEGLQVDLIVNNAGNSVVGRFDEVPWEVHEQRLRLMGIATWRLTHGVLPGMVERGWGRIINVSSIGAIFTSFTPDITYSSTKRMVEQFSECLDAEFRDLGVRCTVSLPGPTPTEIFQHPGSSPDVAEHPVFRHIQTSPELVARETYRAVMEGKPFLVPGLQYKPLSAVLQYAPRRVRRQLSDLLCGVMAD